MEGIKFSVQGWVTYGQGRKRVGGCKGRGEINLFTVLSVKNILFIE